MGVDLSTSRVESKSWMPRCLRRGGDRAVHCSPILAWPTDSIDVVFKAEVPDTFGRSWLLVPRVIAQQCMDSQRPNSIVGPALRTKLNN